MNIDPVENVRLNSDSRDLDVVGLREPHAGAARFRVGRAPNARASVVLTAADRERLPIT